MGRPGIVRNAGRRKRIYSTWGNSIPAFLARHANPMALRPLGNNILIDPIQDETTTASGIVLAKSDKPQPERGVVMAVGPSVTDVFSGDQVIFKKYAPDEVKDDDGKVYLIVPETDIMAEIYEGSDDGEIQTDRTE